MVLTENSPLLRLDHGHSKAGSPASNSKVEIKIYKRRWYVLFVFTAQAMIYNIAWNTWAPIQEPSKIAFGWTDVNLLMLASWAPISFFVTLAPLTWLIHTKGWLLTLFWAQTLTERV